MVINGEYFKDEKEYLENMKKIHKICEEIIKKEESRGRKMSIEEFIKKHKPLNLYIEYNDHKTSYETVEEYIEERDIKDEEIIDKEECIKNDTIYSLQIYPKTPIRILFNIFFKFRESNR